MIKKNSRHNALAFYVIQIPQIPTPTTKTNEHEHSNFLNFIWLVIKLGIQLNACRTSLLSLIFFICLLRNAVGIVLSSVL